MFQWLSLWFGFQSPVTRQAYLLSGFGLATFKYCLEAYLVWVWTGQFYSPLQFLSPLYSHRAAALSPMAPELGWALVLLSFPFLWIALSMSVRRALSAGLSAGWGFLVLVPLLNYLVMIVLSSLPNLVHGLPQPQRDVDNFELEPQANHWKSFTVSMLGGLSLQTAVLLFSVYTIDHYGWMLFFGGPVVSGTVTGFLFNRNRRPDAFHTLGISILMQLAFAAGLLLFALEGLICIFMAVPLVVPLGVLGGFLGYLLALNHADDWQNRAALLVVLPLGFLTTRAERPPLVAVTSTVEIHAPPKQVWSTVLAFPELPPPDEFEFQAGIACPMSAHIEGTGVGAIRHCVFTTGEFVEPITVWHEPRHLAFDVTSQPEPMFELTPYRDIHPPHLHGTFRSERGEFRLEPTAAGTRLTGTTWYRLEMQPLEYWGPLTEYIIHRIHHRVLNHVKQCAEQG